MVLLDISRRCGIIALLLAASLLFAGCRGNGAGDTVPSPPRDLVEKSFHPPAGAGPPATAKPDAANSSSGSAGK